MASGTEPVREVGPPGGDPPGRPLRSVDATEYPLGDEVLIYVPGRASAFSLNESARAIWGLCDGSRSAADMARLLGDLMSPPGEVPLADVEQTITKLWKLGLLES